MAEDEYGTEWDAMTERELWWWSLTDQEREDQVRWWLRVGSSPQTPPQ